VLCVVRPLVLTSNIDAKRLMSMWETSVQQESRQYGLEVSYLGSRGPAPALDQPGEPAGSRDELGGAPLAISRIGCSRAAANVGYSRYNSLGLKLTRRYSNGLTVLGTTQFQVTDNGSGIRTLGTDR